MALAATDAKGVGVMPSAASDAKGVGVMPLAATDAAGAAPLGLVFKGVVAGAGRMGGPWVWMCGDMEADVKGGGGRGSSGRGSCGSSCMLGCSGGLEEQRGNIGTRAGT